MVNVLSSSYEVTMREKRESHRGKSRSRIPRRTLSNNEPIVKWNVYIMNADLVLRHLFSKKQLIFDLINSFLV